MKPIKPAVYDRWVKRLDKMCRHIIKSKRPVYTGKSADVVKNFRMAAQFKKSTPGSELSTYLIKQTLSVVGLLTDPTLTDSERDTRFADARNYIDIGYVMWKEGVAHEKYD